MNVWVVIEEDRGAGAMIAGVYATQEQAETACSGNQWVDGPHVVQETPQ